MRIKPVFYIPIIFAFILYGFVRIVVDPISGMRFWERPWQTTAIEIIGSLFLAYMLFFATYFLVQKFNKEKIETSSKQIRKEVFWVLLVNFILINLYGIPFIHFTDNGIQIHDPIILNFVGLSIVLISFIFLRANYYLEAFVGERTQKEKLARENVESELKFLKAQINPHFLFNSLNGIYFMIDEEPEFSKRMLESLSEMLRYQLYECNDDRVALKKELNYINNYLNIQKMRRSESMDIIKEWGPFSAHHQIAPFLLINLVENAFKYVDTRGKILLQTEIEDDFFTFRIGNSFYSNKKIQGEVGGIGLSNLKRRLELLYPDKYELNIKEKDKYFQVNLRLNINEN